MIVYKDGIKIYEFNTQDLEALITSIQGNISSNYLDKDIIANMVASARSLYQVATLPASPTNNTIYYVGTESPYHVYLYDSNGTQVDLGTSELNLANYYTKTESDNKFLDKTDFLNTMYPKGSIYVTYENKNPSTFIGGTWELVGGQDANLNYYPAFAISTDTAGTTISESLPNIIGSFTTQGAFNGNIGATGAFRQTNSFQNEENTSGARQRGTIDFNAGFSNPIYQNNAHVNVNAIKLFFWRRTDDAPIVYNTGNITMDTEITSSATDDHIPTSKAVYDYIPKVYKQLYRFNSGVASGNITLYDDLTKFTFCEILVKKSGSTDSFSVKANVQRMIAGAEQPCLNLYASGGIWCKATYVNATTLQIGGSGTLSVVEVIGWY